MAEQQPIRFNDGAAYERMMGVWSRLAGEDFLRWLGPKPGLKWVDIGCGNGAFTEMVVANHAPAGISGVDPSEGQLAYARTRRGVEMAEFHRGDAMALPFPDRSFDVAIMALVIFFVPEPARGVAEMVRVVAPGGMVAAYAWDIVGGGFPWQPVQTELKAMGFNPARPPTFEVSQMDELKKLWSDAGLIDIETHRIDVERSFANFDDYWGAVSAAPTLGELFAKLPPDQLAGLKNHVRGYLDEDSQGRISYGAWANAIKGRVPG